MRNTAPSILAILRRQFDPSFRMLTDVLDACPEFLWTEPAAPNPFWQQVMHALIGVQFWFREAEEKIIIPDFGQGPIPDLDQSPSFSVSKDAVREYRSIVAKRVDAFFASLDDQRLTTLSSIYDKCTYADLILMQIRHIQHHVGYCNSILHGSNAKTAKWLGYAE
jgi:hypothetical protein